jgi:TRAP-type C4-dicarboxylate transport system substrate-binding protein
MKEKRMRWFIIVGVFILSLLVVALEPPPVEAEEITLVWAAYYPPSYYSPGKPFAPIGDFVDNVNKLGKGKVKLNAYWSGELLGADQLVSGLQMGTADIIGQTGSYTTGSWPIISFLQLPFLWKGDESIYQHTKIGTPLRNLLDKHMEEKYGIKQIAISSVVLLPAWLAKKRAVKPKDFKGLKIRTGGIGAAWGVQALEASPVETTSAELYDALSRGTVDGMIGTPGTIQARKLYEVIKYCLDTGFSADTIHIFMKKDKWDGLPQDVRDIIIKAANTYEHDLIYYDMKMKEGYMAEFRKAGMEVTKLSPKEEKEFKAAVKKSWNKFAEKVDPKLAEKIIGLAQR